ncbi:small integral membrane protein 32 isoform X1 [Gallus gallus]|uniref:small integral membrane protein 32 isoform X1 n=1 Tax=Gallus gallus TaxID=9031 RepID=UPI001F014881|nr:small integral membrane protein 32 isoform X1 [Gallus gallus]
MQSLVCKQRPTKVQGGRGQGAGKTRRPPTIHVLLCSVLLWLQGDTTAKRNAWKATSPALEWALHRAPITGIKKLNSCTGIPAAGRILGESTANPAGCQRFSRPSPRIPFNPGSIPLGKSTRRAAVPSPGRHRGLQAAQTRSEGCALHVPAGGSGTEAKCGSLSGFYKREYSPFPMPNSDCVCSRSLLRPWRKFKQEHV